MPRVSESLYVGGLAEFEGKKGLILDMLPGTKEAHVAFLTGGTAKVDVRLLKMLTSLSAAGLDAGTESFDIFLGPMHRVDMFGESISNCLFEKGFCVIKVCNSVEERQMSIANMQAMGEEGRLSRLAFEVEEGYLGTGSKGKVAWLKKDSPHAPTDPLLLAADELFSQLLSSLSPYSRDSLGAACNHRTTGLASFSIKEAEVFDYPNPIAEDKDLCDLLKIWRLGLLRGVHYMGPETSKVTLTFRNEVNPENVPARIDKISISATPNTIILYRPSLFKYSSIDVGSTLSLRVTFMKAEPDFVLDTFGDPSILGDVFPGPAPPVGGVPLCDHASARMPGSWDSAEMYTSSQPMGPDVVIQLPISRFDWEMYYEPDPAKAEPWQSLTKHFAMVDGLEYFDNKYFSIPANEAIVMGTMQRHLLECGAQNMIKMGITKKIADREPHHAGCSVGLDKDDWNTCHKLAECGSGGSNVIAIISNRFSFTFNLRGVNYVTDTACSSSLVATHFARGCMRDRTHDELEFFVCMGIHNCLNISNFIAGSQSGMFSKRGRTSTFNDTADGFSRGDGCSGFVMTWGTMDDECLAVWRGSMTGQNGRSATLMAPNGLAQEELCWRAIREADAKPGEGVVWSCHGTGTSLGDPIEIAAVRKVQKGERNETKLCINTNKTNHGHFEGGAAMTSLVSALYQCAKNRVNANIHLQVFNTHIVTDNFDARFFNEIINWGETRKQGHLHVSSFGAGGTNAHCIFWGRDKASLPSLSTIFRQRLLQMSPPEIHPVGSDPADWEYELRGDACRPGDIYSIPIAKEDPRDAPIRYVKKESALEDGAMDSDIAYSIRGNFNDWTADVMNEGDVPGIWNCFIEVPEDGHIEFNFCKTIEENLILAPDRDFCIRRTAKVVGPAEDLTNKWLAMGSPGSNMKISLFASQGFITVSWVELRKGLNAQGKSCVMDLLDDL